MGRLEEFKERVNKNSKINIPVDEANKFIVEALTNDYLPYAYTNWGLKLRLLYCLKVSMCDKLQLKQDQINYSVTQVGCESNIAGVRRVRCDGKYTIVINEKYLQEMSHIYFLEALLHEYGHIYQVEAEISGETMPEAIFIDYISLDDESKWQKQGANLKYKANDNEYIAQKFVYEMEKFYLSMPEAKMNTCGYMKRVLRNGTMRMKNLYKNRQAKALLTAWKTLSRVRKIPESTAVSYEHQSMGIPSIVKELDRTMDKITTIKSSLDAQLFLSVLNKSLQEKELSLESDFIFKVDLLNAYCYKLAEKYNCSRSSVGFMLYPDKEEFIELVKPYKYDSNCSLTAYFLINLDAFEHMAPMLFAKNVIENTESILNNESPFNNSSSF